MRKRIITKVGDVFQSQIGKNEKKLFQYIASDLKQLNSDVIRVFKKTYSLDITPSLDEVIQDEIDFYAHCVTKFGIKMNLWTKVGNISNVGNISEIIFRSTDDYGTKEGEEPIRISNNWHIWRINDDDFTKVGKLTGHLRNSYIGLVYNPLSIIDMLQGKKMPPHYPDFE